MNILGVDYGRRRIGLAWVQAGLDVVLPFGVVDSKDINEQIDQLKRIIEEESINQLVVGLPISLGGEENENTKRVQTFAASLQARVDIPVSFIDERFTTAQAKQMGGDATLDEKAAMLILQSYTGKSS